MNQDNQDNQEPQNDAQGVQSTEPIAEPTPDTQEPQKRSKAEKSRLVRGYGILFNHESRDLGGFVEEISPTALDMALVDSSDIKVYLDHNRDRGILARRNKGNGSLSVSIDERGVIYEFDAPNTALGDEVVEGLSRGDYNESSFAFTVAKDSWDKRSDGTYKRTVLAIERLYDFSIVADGAYSDTYVSLAKRSLCEHLKEEYRNANEEELKEVVENRSLPSEIRDYCENKIEELRKAQDNKVDNNVINKEERKMEQKFSLLKAIADIANGRQLDERSLEVINQGRESFRRAGHSYSGQIQLPFAEERSVLQAGADTLGKETVQTDLLNILEPLRANLVMAKAGATILTGLTGDFAIPAYTGTQAGWETELGAAKDGAGTFKSIKFAPKRLTTYVDVSKLFLIQDSVQAEEMLRRDIVNAIAQKLEETILGNGAGDAYTPAGLFANATSMTAVNHANIVGLEQALEEANVNGDKCFIVSPAIKAKLKTTAIDAGSGRFLLEDNEVNGYPVYSTTNAKGMLFGKMDDYVIGVWGATDIVVDSVTQAVNGAVRLVVSAYFDCKPRRTESFIAKTVAASK
jgi:HK97 family phage major capsid protein/HK97 family phage prohead protease